MNKVVAITGATSGIGEQTAIFLKDKGYCVYSLARRIKDIEGIKYLKCDVTNKEEVRNSFQTIQKNEGRIDAVINNAGLGISGAFEYTTETDSKKIIDCNLIGVMNVDEVAIPYLKETEGRIIHIGSIAGVLPIPFQAYYSLTKAAIHSLSESLSMELKPFNIKVSCVMPGDTKTNFTLNRIKDLKMDGYNNRITRSVSKMERDEKKGTSPIKVSKIIYKCLIKKNPPLKVAVGFNYKLILFLNRILPNRLVNYILYQMYAK